MNVAELIEILQKQPQELQVAYSCCSEYTLLREDEIFTYELCEPRPDGWIHTSRDDKPKQTFLLITGY